MDVNTIKIDRYVAWAKADQYRARLEKMKPSFANEEVRAEYEMALKGYEALKKGTPLIDLNDVMRNCPLDHKSRPRLAIARHDRKQVKFEWGTFTSKAMFHTDLERTSFPLQVLDSLAVHVNMGREHRERTPGGISVKTEGYAMVPMIPPHAVPKTGVPEKAFILWEVERWSDTRLDVAPDIDPYLLKHVAGPLYAVIAEWELTDLERSIMRGRMTHMVR